MKNLKRQDRNGTRTTTDIERKYKLGQIDYTAEEIEELKLKIVVDSSLSASSPNAIANSTVTQALNNKVNKETGKGLSTNDYTDADKEKLDKLPENIDGALSLLDVYPVGSIYMSVNDVDPSTLFGGTWEAWGSGRVPVGVDAAQTEFATVEKTGGEKTHTLTTDEMPKHNHAINTANGQGTMEWGYQFLYENNSASYNGIMQYVGNSQPHNNLQPYITCYMWKRTA